ncbi:MAG: hypothetical protein IIC53_07905 [Proteobacteria bacterium]|nr:hypothetical protein [Pseudomonadota bacterium]
MTLVYNMITFADEPAAGTEDGAALFFFGSSVLRLEAHPALWAGPFDNVAH